MRSLFMCSMVFVSASSFGQTPSQATLEVKIASIDAGHLVAAGSPQARRAASAMKAASQRCTAQGSQLADQAAAINKEVVGKGHDSSIVQVLEGVDAMLVDFGSRQDCASVMAAYAVSRMEGYTHSRSVVMGRAMMKTLAEANKR